MGIKENNDKNIESINKKIDDSNKELKVDFKGELK